MRSRRPKRLFLAAVGVGLGSLFGLMAPTCEGGTARVRLLISDQLPLRERLAADELKLMLERLFEVRAELSTEPDETADAVIAFGATRRAEEAQDVARALAQSELAYDRIRSALLTYAEVARDHGDLGSIAAMNAYCYRPIRDKRNHLREQVRAPHNVKPEK